MSTNQAKADPVESQLKRGGGGGSGRGGGAVYRATQGSVKGGGAGGPGPSASAPPHSNHPGPRPSGHGANNAGGGGRRKNNNWQYQQHSVNGGEAILQPISHRPSGGNVAVPAPKRPVQNSNNGKQPVSPSPEKTQPDVTRAPTAMTFQFGSFSPGGLGPNAGVQIPARTTSAPPNLDEQKREQAKYEASRAAKLIPPVVFDHPPLPPTQPVRPAHIPIPMQVVSSQPPTTMQQPLQQPVLQHGLVQPPAFTPGAKFQPPPVIPSQVGTSMVGQQQMMPHQHHPQYSFVPRASRALKIVNPETQEEVLPSSVLPRGAAPPPMRPMNFTGPSPPVNMNQFTTPLSTAGPPFFPLNMGDSQRMYAPPGGPGYSRGAQVAPPAAPPSANLESPHPETRATPSEAPARAETVVDSTVVAEERTVVAEVSNPVPVPVPVSVPVPEEVTTTTTTTAIVAEAVEAEVSVPDAAAQVAESESAAAQDSDQSDGNPDADPKPEHGDSDEKTIEGEVEKQIESSSSEVEPAAAPTPRAEPASSKPAPPGGKRKNMKKFLAKADAAGSNADLYNAYKAPAPDEKKDEVAPPAEQPDVESKSDTKPSIEVESPKELDDWEDAADLPTPAAKSDENSTKKRYTRDFLLTHRDHNLSLPAEFEVRPDIEMILVPPVDVARGIPRRPEEDRWIKQPLTPRMQDVRIDGFRPGSNPSAGMRFPPPMLPNMPPHMLPNRGVDSLSWIHPQKGLIPSPTAPPPMHKAEKRYEIGKVSDEEDSKQRQVKGILNKLTPQNFEKLFARVQDLGIETAETLNGVISQIFDKAIMEPTFCETYARFCVELSVALPEFAEEGQKVTFKRVLLNKCQEVFERGKREEEEAGKTEEDGVAITDEERESRRLKARRRMLGNIRFIGELYKKSMLTERIMHQCITSLLENPDDEDVEALCKLMTTIGHLIDHHKAKAHMDAYFGRISDLSNNPKLSSRLRFGLKDVIDLRSNDWHQRRKVEGPKKIEEVHRDAQQERLAQANSRDRDRFSRGTNMNRRVPPSPGGMSPMGRGMPPGRFMQDVRKEDQFVMDRPMPMPMTQRSEEFTFGPQGGLGRGPMRGTPGPPAARSALGDVPPKMQVDYRRPGTAPSINREPYTGRDEFAPRGAPAGFGERPLLGRPMTAAAAPGGKEFRGLERSSSDRLAAYSSMGRPVTPPTPVTPVPPTPPPPPPQLTEEQLRKKSSLAMEEYYSIRDVKEAVQCVEELGRPDFHAKMVSQWILESFERKDAERDLMAKLIQHLRQQEPALLTYDQIREGLASVLAVFEDTVVDVPKAADYLGSVVGKLVAHDAIPLVQVEKLIKEGGAEKDSLLLTSDGLDIFGAVLGSIRQEKGEEDMLRIYNASGASIHDLVLNPRPGEVEAFLTKKNLLCLDPVMPIESYVKDAFANNVPVPEVLKWLEANAAALFTNAAFLRMLMTEVLNQTVHVPADDYEGAVKGVRKYSDLLRKITGANARAMAASQGQYILALQLFAHQHGHPSGLMTALFNSFYTDEVISENAFFKWQDDVKDPTPGREQAIREVGKWLRWLQEAPEEDN